MREPGVRSEPTAEQSHHDRTGHADALHSTPAIVEQSQEDESAGEGESAECRRAPKEAPQQTRQQTGLGLRFRGVGIVRHAGRGIVWIVHRTLRGVGPRGRSAWYSTTPRTGLGTSQRILGKQRTLAVFAL